MKIQEIIMKGFKVAHANMPLLVLLFVYNVVLAILAIIIMGQSPMAVPGAVPQVGALAVKGLIYNVITLALWVFAQGGILNLLKKAVPSESSQDLGLFWEGGQKFYLPLLILTLILVVPLVVILGLMGFLGAAGLAILIILALVVLIAYVIFLVFAMFAPYEVVVDGKDAISAIKSSLGLVSKNFWSVVIILALLILIGLGIGFLIGLVMGVLTFVLKAIPILGTIITIAFTSAINAYVIVVVTSALTAYYLSLVGGKTEAVTPKP